MHPFRHKKTPYSGKTVAVPDSPLAGDPQLCRRFNIEGQWETVCAPWAIHERDRAVDMTNWIRTHAGAPFQTTLDLLDRDNYKPLLEVYQLNGFDPSWAESNMLGMIAGENFEGPNFHNAGWCGLFKVRMYFLVDPFAVGKLVREWMPVLYPPRVVGAHHRSQMHKLRNELAMLSRLN